MTKNKLNQNYKVKNAGKKVVFIIPGMYESEDKFKTIEGYYSDVGITPIFINMDWRITHLKDFVNNSSEEVKKVASLYPDREIYFFGFSLGAVVALNNAEKYNSKGTIICSLSPFFQDDWGRNPSFMKEITKILNIKLPVYKSIPEETAVFLYGDQDNSMIRSDQIVKERESIYPSSKFIEVKGAKHDITGEAYLEQIKQEINKLKEPDNNE